MGISNGQVNELSSYSTSTEYLTGTASRVFVECAVGVFDSFRLDQDGRLWTSEADCAHCLHAQKELMEKALLAEMVGNLCFGGSRQNSMFIAGRSFVLFRISERNWSQVIRGVKLFP